MSNIIENIEIYGQYVDQVNSCSQHVDEQGRINQMTFSPESPFNELPRLPPAKEVETRPILKQCIIARAALAELKQAGELIPNPAMLVNTLPLLEAQASSEIENIVTTADQLFQYASYRG